MKEPLAVGPERLDWLMEECLKEAEADLAARSLAVTRQIGADIPLYPMDRGLVKEALACLLAEAIRGARPEARLRVTVKANRNALMCALKAPGAGLGELQREFLFTGEAHPGTLARARAIIAAHGGTAWANGMPGRGVTYYISLPMRPPA